MGVVVRERAVCPPVDGESYLEEETWPFLGERWPEGQMWLHLDLSGSLGTIYWGTQFEVGRVMFSGTFLV